MVACAYSFNEVLDYNNWIDKYKTLTTTDDSRRVSYIVKFTSYTNVIRVEMIT